MLVAVCLVVMVFVTLDTRMKVANIQKTLGSMSSQTDNHAVTEKQSEPVKTRTFETFDAETPKAYASEAEQVGTESSEMEQTTNPGYRYYNETLGAYVTWEPYGAGTLYTLSREEFETTRTVKAFCLEPNAYERSLKNTTRYLLYDYEMPRPYSSVWSMTNSYGFGCTLSSDLTAGEPVYRLALGDTALELDAEMVNLVEAALSGVVNWTQTEYGAYLNADGEIDLDKYLEHFGYTFEKMERDVPRGGMTEDCVAGDWAIYRYYDDEIRLMADGERLFWARCEHEDWETAWMSLVAFDDTFKTPVIINGQHVMAEEHVLGTLLQFVNETRMDYYAQDGREVVQKSYYEDFWIDKTSG